MNFMQIQAGKLELVELTCGDTQCQIKEANHWLEVGGEGFVQLNPSVRAIASFILKCTDLRPYKEKSSDRLLDVIGIHELRELRNTWTSDSKQSIFDAAPKKPSPRKDRKADWPEIISVDVKVKDYPKIKVLSRNSRDNEHLWVRKDDLGVAMEFIKLKGLNRALKRTRHELPHGIQKRKSKTKDAEGWFYIVSTKNIDGTKYTSFQSLEEAMEHQQNAAIQDE
jgi:hypothetical protein